MIINHWNELFSKTINPVNREPFESEAIFYKMSLKRKKARYVKVYLRSLFSATVAAS